MIWIKSFRCDSRIRPVADRHYNRQSVGAPNFVPPGRCLVLRTPANDALWVTSWPFAQYTKHKWAGAWVNSTFRREGGSDKASDMIRSACGLTRGFWADMPPLGMVTFLDPKKVKPVMVRGRATYGRSYLLAGFKHVGYTKGGLWTFQLLPEDMPAAVLMPNAQLRLAM